MDCAKFEERISEYLDGVILKADRTVFREHTLKCRACRALLDDIRGALDDCKIDDAIDLPSELETTLMTIAQEEPSLFACRAFEDLITEFLDGFVPAAVYHRFEEHASECGNCSTLLTDVVYAVAACHSVHTYEEVEIPETLFAVLERIAGCEPARKTLASRITAFASSLIPRATVSARWTFATASSLVFATVAFLLFGFSDDGTVAGIYRQAQVEFGRIYSQGADIYSSKDELAARIERVGHGIGEIWDSLGGATARDGKTETNQASPNRSSGTKRDAAEKK
jgi:predicted anti-sigma-YlaC factor YlaD